MKKIIGVALLAASFASPAFAEFSFDQKKLSVGGAMNTTNSGIGVFADYSIADQFDNRPVYAQVGYYSYKDSTQGTVTGNSNRSVLYVAGRLEFPGQFDGEMGKKLRTFTTIGLQIGGLMPFYGTAGIAYEFSKQLNFEAALPLEPMGITLGAVYKF